MTLVNFGKSCPSCGGHVQCIDSRTPNSKAHAARQDVICRRRYKCASCGEAFSTYEVTADDFANLEAAKSKLQQTLTIIRAALLDGDK